MARVSFDPGCGLDITTTTIGDLADIATISYYGYRLVRHPDGTHYVHEAYYDYREGLLGIARKPAEPCGDTTEGVDEVLQMMKDAVREPVLRYADQVPEAMDD